MKNLLLAALLFAGFGSRAASLPPVKSRFFGAGDARIHYTGRIGFANARKPRFWAPGFYLSGRFQGLQKR